MHVLGVWMQHSRGVDISSSSLCEFIMSQASRYTYLRAHAPQYKSVRYLGINHVMAMVKVYEYG